MSDNWNTLRFAEYYVNTMGFSVIPILPEDKRPALRSWAEYQNRKPKNEELLYWFEDGINNIGIVTGSVSGITVVDIDPNADEDRLRTLLGDQIHTASVTTPRGGKHLYYHYYEDLRNRAGALRSVDVRGDGGYVVAPPSTGVNGVSYKWDNPLASFNPGRLTEEFVRELRGTANVTVDTVGEMFTEGRRDQDLFHVANALIKGGIKVEEATAIITRLAKTCKPAFPAREALDKVRSAIERASRKERNLTQEIRDWISSNDGFFNATEVIQDLQVFEKADKNKVYVVLSRLREEGVIEKHTAKRGVFRRRENKLEAMDWMSADCSTFDVALPLGLNDLAELYPNNITVVAGSPDSGKTAILINIAKANMNNHEVHYFNSEMGVAEFRNRLSKHKDLELGDWRLKAWSRTSLFADCIVPDAINIIDYLEMSDDFSKVAAELDGIYRRLDGGLAFVGLQKKYGAALGRGAEFSLEKPRLYLSVDSGRVRIIKAKNWKDPSRNPNGLTKEFKLLGGASFIETTGWCE